MVTRPRRRPLLEYPDELALRKIGSCEILRDVGETVSFERRIANLEDAVEGELSVDANFELPAVALEVPGPQPAMGRQPHVDARVGEEVLRRLGSAVLREIGLRPDHREANVGTDADRDHVLGDLLAEAHPGIEALSDNVDESAFDVDLDFHLRIFRQYLGQLRPKDRRRGMIARRDANGTGRLPPQLIQRRKLCLDLLEPRPYGAQEPLARLRR